jgi:glycosyltransferase A (GT-A) superfamily protein (DUF2064 family)
VKVVAVMVQAPLVAVTDRGREPGAGNREPEVGNQGVAEVLAVARGVAGAIVRVALEPGADPKAFADLGIAGGQVMTPKGESPGDRDRALFQDLFRRGAKKVVLVGADAPLLTSGILEEAFAALEGAPGHVVLGPAGDGGYYLLGLAAPQVPDLFTGVRRGTKYALMDTLRRCEFEERRVTFLPLLDHCG